MAHLLIDITTHLLLALYPAAAIFLIEILGRYGKAVPYKRYVLQGMVSLVFAVAYIILIEGTGIAIILLILAPVLFLHAKRVKENPTIR
ncbi:MAG: hypothetical protein ACE5KA_04950 [Nitrososphaerales archaeon]